MNGKWIIGTAPLAAALFVTGCQTLPPGAEPGPHGTMAYDVLIETTPPGAKIEANGQVIGDAPVHLKIFGDPDGTFHDFGSDIYVIRALPLETNQFVQTRAFGTGKWGGPPEEHIPKTVHFDMNQPPPPSPYPPGGPAPYPYAYPYPAYPSFYFYGPPVYYYGRPYYYHPGLHVYVGPPHH